MKEFKWDTRSHGNFIDGKKQSGFSVLDRLYNLLLATLAFEGAKERA